MQKRFYIYVTSLVALLGVVAAINLSGAARAATIDNSPDCDTVAIIKCGAYTKRELLSDFDANTYGDLPRVYGAFGINRADLANGTFVDGVVWRDGRVTVNNKTVATNATTAGRWNNPTGDMTRIKNTSRAYRMSTRHFTSEGQTAMVRMENGKFKFAIIKSCGNPVTATAKTQPKPQYECTNLAADKISRTKYRFTAKANATDGATIEQYEYGFGDGYGITTKQSSYTYTYKEAGTYTATVKVHVKVNGKTVKVDGPDCKVTVTVKDVPPVQPEEKPKQPQQPEEAPEEIAVTGPAEIAGGLAGIGGLTAAGYHWRASRRALIERLLNR